MKLIYKLTPMKNIYLLFLLFCSYFISNSQNNVGIGTNTPNASAKLDITDANKGMLIPRVALTATNAAGPITSPAASLLVYNTASASSGATFVSPGYYYWDGAKWIRLLNSKTVNANNGLSIVGDTLVQLGGTLIQTTTITQGSNIFKIENNGTTNTIINLSSTGDFDVQDNGTSALFVKDDGNVGIGNNNPDDKLDVTGNAQVSGYIRAGNPTAPNIPAGYDIIYQDDFEGDVFWTVDGVQNCGAGTWGYPLLTSGDLFSTSIGWNTAGSRSRKRFQSPSIWIPTYYTSFYITDNSRTFDEDGFDGVYLLWKDEGTTGSGTTWTKITSFNNGGYGSRTATGSSTACGTGTSQSCWDFNDKGTDYGLIYDESTNISSTGRYVRIGFEGMEDASADDETFYIYDCVLYGNRPSFNSTFNAGSIYSEGPIFASVQYRLGDLAEYFEVDKNTEAGDLIAISDKGNDKYTKATAQNAALILGIHSANPTITLNSPKNGVPVALAGRVPVKVNNENGAIKIGDYITISSTPGVGTKATKPCYTIGRALENFNGKEGKILCMVQTGWANVNSRPTITSGGSFNFSKGTDIIKVIDQSVQPDSRVFVSFREFPGSEFKVGKIGNGFFELQLKQKTTTQIPFDYFIDNAAIPTKINGTKGEINIVENIPTPTYNSEITSSNTASTNNIKVENTIDSPNKLSPELEAKFPSKQVAVINAKVDDGSKTPPLPPDPNQVWLWTADRGFFTMADVRSSKSPYKEIELQKQK